MASTYSPLKIQLMATGENSATWGTVTNTNLGTAIEEMVSGSADVTFASAQVTLTLTDSNATQTARNMRLNLTGTSGGAQNLIVPAVEKLYVVNNGCADAITVKNSTGTGVAVPAGKSMLVYNDGTNVVDAITALTTLTTGSVLASSNDSGALGASGTAFSDLFLASGGVINWNAGNVTLTHSAGALNLSGNLFVGTGVADTRLYANSSTPYAVGVAQDGGSNGFYFFGATAASSPDLIFSNNAGTERVRLTDAGNLGIGMTPTEVLDITKSQNAASVIQIQNTNGSGAAIVGLQCYNGSTYGNIYQYGTGFTTSTYKVANQTFFNGNGAGGVAIGAVANAPLKFITNNTEYMRLDASGNLLVGKTAPGLSTSGFQTGPTGQTDVTVSASECMNITRLSSYGQVIRFFQTDASTLCGSIATSAGATAYNTSSDVRLKENIVDSAPSGDIIDAIRIREFDFKNGGIHVRYGVVAQEVVSVTPEIVSKGDTEEETWGVDYSRLVPILVKEIQSLRVRVAALEAKAS